MDMQCITGNAQRADIDNSRVIFTAVDQEIFGEVRSGDIGGEV